MNKKIGLALGSGGGRGLFHLGVLTSLEKNDVQIDFVAGSSIGALRFESSLFLLSLSSLCLFVTGKFVCNKNPDAYNGFYV